MSDAFFEKPILNSPYLSPSRHWELDESGQPTQNIVETRRRVDLITPIPTPRNRKKSVDEAQEALVFDEGKGLSTATQQYDPTSVVNNVRRHVDRWRLIPDTKD